MDSEADQVEKIITITIGYDQRASVFEQTMDLAEQLTVNLTRFFFLKKIDSRLFIQMINGIRHHDEIKLPLFLKILKARTLELTLPKNSMTCPKPVEFVRRIGGRTLQFRLQTNRTSTAEAAIKAEETGSATDVQNVFPAKVKIFKNIIQMGSNPSCWNSFSSIIRSKKSKAECFSFKELPLRKRNPKAKAGVRKEQTDYQAKVKPILIAYGSEEAGRQKKSDSDTKVPIAAPFKPYFSMSNRLSRTLENKAMTEA